MRPTARAGSPLDVPGVNIGLSRKEIVGLSLRDSTLNPRIPDAASCKQEPAPRLRDGTPQLPGCLQPFRDNHLDIGECLLARDAIRSAASQLRYFGNERIILATPVQNDLLLRH